MNKKMLKPNSNLVKSNNHHKVSTSTNKISLLSLSGVNNESGLYKGSKEADKFITKLRDEWD